MRNIFFRKHLGLCTLPLFLAVCMSMSASAVVSESIGIEGILQNDRTVTVIVKDAMGEVIGANVLVKGTTIGGITNMDGVAVIQGVPNNATIQVSFVGYVTQEIALQNGQTSLEVTLREDSETLEEVVVVGYGTQAKKDITGSVAVVSRDAIAEQPVASFAEALQGRASGVYVSSGGGPAGETTIRIRGVGGVNGSDPLVIVDGVQGVEISSVNANDIESMQVLKDAAATAIYGARAANGVIIITTKQGTKEGKVRFTYNGYISASTMANSGYKMLGAWDTMLAEQQSQHNMVDYRGVDINTITHQQFGSISNGDLQMPYAIVPAGYSKEQIIDKFGSVDNWIASYNGASSASSYAKSAYYYIKEDLGGSEEEAKAGTNWFDEVTRTGITQNHELSMMGGGEKGQYAASLSYMNREGTIIGSSFERYNVRLNTTFNPTKHVSFGLNSNAALIKNVGERGRQRDTTVFGRTYTVASWVPTHNVSGTYAGTLNGGGRNNTSVAQTELGVEDWARNFRMQTSFFAELKDPWIKGLTLRSQFSTTIDGDWSTEMTEKSLEWNKEGSSFNTFTENSGWGFSWQWTNTAQYKINIMDDHDVTLLVGTEALKMGLGRNQSGSRNDYDFERDSNTWTLDNGGTSAIVNSSSMRDKSTMFGFFGRVDYSYKGKYLATATIRRDASSKFSESNRWGTFPSISLGWRVSDEPFLSKAHETWLDDLKIRIGYGTTGNSNIGAYNYAFQFTKQTYYEYATNGGQSGNSTGYYISSLGDRNAKWETVKMFNVGYDITALNNRLTSSFDFYVKKTSDMLVPANWTLLAGSGTKPNVNIGDLKNVGIDFSIGWRDKIGQVSYNINANASWYKNEVTKLGSSNLFTNTRIDQVTITTVGQPVSMFYGYVLDGIYKNESDVTNYGALPFGVASEKDLVPTNWVGHYKFKDLNGDGKINAQDRQVIGNPHPDLTGGVNIGLNWKNWDLSTYLYYSLGNDLYKHYQYYTLWGNLSNVYSYERVEKAWHPVSNPNGNLPLWVSGDTAIETTASHSGYIDDGSYLRMQTLTIGYTLPRKITQKLTLSRIRLYAQLANVFTITGYDGLDPEVRSDASLRGGVAGESDDMSKGIDYGAYGMPRQYLFGVNIEF